MTYPLASAFRILICCIFPFRRTSRLAFSSTHSPLPPFPHKEGKGEESIRVFGNLILFGISFIIARMRRLIPPALLALPALARAAGGPLGDANEINVGGGGGGTDLRGTIIHLTKTVLTYVSLAAVVVIIIAGIWLIVGLGEESAKEKARKIVLYTIIGLLLILLANGIVTFIIGL